MESSTSKNSLRFSLAVEWLMFNPSPLKPPGSTDKPNHRSNQNKRVYKIRMPRSSSRFSETRSRLEAPEVSSVSSASSRSWTTITLGRFLSTNSARLAAISKPESQRKMSPFFSICLILTEMAFLASTNLSWLFVEGWTKRGERLSSRRSISLTKTVQESWISMTSRILIMHRSTQMFFQARERKSRFWLNFWRHLKPTTIWKRVDRTMEGWPLKSLPSTTTTFLPVLITMTTSPWWWTTPGISKAIQQLIKNMRKVGQMKKQSLKVKLHNSARNPNQYKEVDKWVEKTHLQLHRIITKILRLLLAEIRLHLRCSEGHLAKECNNSRQKRITSKKSGLNSRRLSHRLVSVVVYKSRDLNKYQDSKLS